MEEFDVIFSLGPACRAAYYLQLSGNRTWAYPLDWQMCSIESALHLYETKFADFFLDYQDLPNKVRVEGLRYVVDTKNNIVSMHHIKKDEPLDKAVKNFRMLMLKRYKRLDSHLKKAKSIMILSNHNRKLDVLINFLIRFADIYSNKKITLVNIHSRINGKNKHVHKINDNLTIIEYFFNDIHKDGVDSKVNKNFWLGNEEKWLEILNNYYKS